MAAYGIAGGNDFQDQILASAAAKLDRPRWDQRDAYRSKRRGHTLGKRLRYGRSTKAAMDLIIDSMSPAEKRALGNSQLAARATDNMWGRGKYRRGRRPVKRRRWRGRGLYGLPSLASAKRGARIGSRWTGALSAGMGAAGYHGGSSALGAVSKGLSAFGGSGLYVGGRGSYAVAGNALIEGMGSAIPKFGSEVSDETGGMSIVHEEFVMDIYGNEWINGKPKTTFQSVDFSLNPGLARTFPFLSQMANNFEEYEFMQLLFTFKSKVSENLSSTDGQVGSILMYTEYNAGDKPKTSKQQIMQSYGNSNARIIDTIMHGVECDPKKINGDGQKFIRNAPISGTTDLVQYDHGLFQCVVCNTPEALSNQVIGELYVSYNVRLRKPRTYTLYGLALDRDEFNFRSNNLGYTGTGGFYQDSESYHAKVKAGLYNSIGCKFVGTDFSTGGGESKRPKHYKIIFPANFSGDVVIDFWEDNITDDTFGLNAGTVNETVNFHYPTLRGEVTQLNVSPINQPHEAAEPDKWARALLDNRNTKPLEEVRPAVYMCRIWVHVEQATSGIDNEIDFAGGASLIGDRSVGYCAVTRWNGHETSTFDPELASLPTI